MRREEGMPLRMAASWVRRASRRTWEEAKVVVCVAFRERGEEGEWEGEGVALMLLKEGQ